MKLMIPAAVAAFSISSAAQAHENDVSITQQGDEVCVASNGAPNHDMGDFPTRGNPNSFSEQDLEYCFDADPELTGRITRNVQTSGVSVTGIPFRPGTAEYYDGSSRRGFSRNPSSGWRVEGMGAADMLGMDDQNAHVDHTGLYHYHGVSEGLLETLNSTQAGWAADGFEIHYLDDRAKSSWQLKEGRRPTVPFGAYDGTYEQDWEHVAGSGNLDECNGATVDGTYTYFLTDTYPFYPRCFKGTVSSDFGGRR